MDLLVYIQARTFKQYHRELEVYEKWKINALGCEGVVIVPEINYESSNPVDDIFEFSKSPVEY